MTKQMKQLAKIKAVLHLYLVYELQRFWSKYGCLSHLLNHQATCYQHLSIIISLDSVRIIAAKDVPYSAFTHNNACTTCTNTNTFTTGDRHRRIRQYYKQRVLSTFMAVIEQIASVDEIGSNKNQSWNYTSLWNMLFHIMIKVNFLKELEILEKLEIFIKRLLFTCIRAMPSNTCTLTLTMLFSTFYFPLQTSLLFCIPYVYFQLVLVL